MSKETYKTEIFGTEVFLIADWSQSASPIWMKFGDGDAYCTGRQVADFGHKKYSAMRHYLEEYVVEGGDDPEDFESEIDAAIDAMVETNDERVDFEAEDEVAAAHRPAVPRP